MARHAQRSSSLPFVRLLLVVTAALVFAFVSGHPVRAANGMAHHPTDTAITGVVVNGTHANAPVPHLSVTLQGTDGSGTHDVASATTDDSGRFAFPHLANAETSVFAVTARFAQGFYSTGAISVDNGTQGVTLTVYDPTSDPSELRITSITALVGTPRPANGLLHIGEYFTFHNSGNTAFVGTMPSGAAQPMGLLRFAVPAGSSNLALGAGFAGAQTAQIATGFGATATVPPGDSQFAFAFDAPYTGSTCPLPFRVEYPADHLLVLTPPPFQLDTHDLSSRGQITSSGQQYEAYTHDALAAGTTLDAQLLGLPAAGEPPAFAFSQLVALAIALALLLTCLLALYLRRGQLASLLRFVPGLARSGSSPAPSGLPGEDADAERERLLRRLLSLERPAAGRRARAQSAHEAARVRASLRDLLATSNDGVRQPQTCTVPSRADSALSADAGAEARATSAPESPLLKPEATNAELTRQEQSAHEVSRIASGGGR